jgi:hypothetical protein
MASSPKAENSSRVIISDFAKPFLQTTRSFCQQLSTLDREQKDLEIFLGIIERKLRKAIDIEQVVILTAEFLRDQIQAGSVTDVIEVIETLESVSSKCSENAKILQELRRTITGGLLAAKNSREITPRLEENI